ncbi:hypothetical protein [Paraburkholderia caledonica]|uniref:Uncharacterized protein n=1 Tax=Paraburkholderia caledonica TaxID=134536 RepID=A0AB73IEC3_9BURK|nr:hypothetical protein [Paraburkholderia caledonica]
MRTSLPGCTKCSRPRTQRPDRGSMRAAKASNAPNAIGHAATNMITQVITEEGKGKLYDPRGVCNRGDGN